MKNDFEVEATPVEKSVKWSTISIIYMGMAITLPMFYAVGNVGLSLGFNFGFLALILSVLCLGFIGAFTGYVGAKTRLSTYMITSISFGTKLSKVINILMTIVLLAWYSLTLTYFGESVKNFLIHQYNIDISINLLILIGGVIIAGSVLHGFSGISKLSWLTIPFLLILLYAMAINAIYKNSVDSIFNYMGNNSLSFGASISALIGSFICGVSILPDVSRYAKTPEDGILGGMGGFIGGQFIVGIPCLFISVLYSDNEFIKNAIAFSPIIAFAILILATWTTNDNNIYSSTLSINAVFKNINRNIIIVILGILGIILACLDIIKYFIPFISLLAVIFPSIAIINVIDYFINEKNYLNYKDYKNDINYKALIAWLIGNCVALITYFKVINITTVPAIDGLIFSALLYIIMMKNRKVK